MAVRPHYVQALRETAALERLAGFDPHVAGTPPLGLDLPDSDIDILCHAPDATALTGRLWREFGEYDDFALRQWTDSGRPVMALRRRGMKAEPAFAAARGLTGDSYEALLTLGGLSNEDLLRAGNISNRCCPARRG